MGGGSYSTVRSMTREANYQTKSREDVFQARTIKNEMSPVGVMRECVDSKEHPATIPVIIGLDETGSMGYVPEKFIKSGMTRMMSSLYSKGLEEAQVLFMGIGDHVYDIHPLQVGQFEADDELMDKWLSSIYLESRGGGNDGESYFLAWKFAIDNMRIDSFDKRGEKGFLFTIGDEHNLPVLEAKAQERIFGPGQYQDETIAELLDAVSEKFHVFHIHIKETRSGKRPEVFERWAQTLQAGALCVDSYEEIPDLISNTINAIMHKEDATVLKPQTVSTQKTDKQEVIL